MKHWLEPISTTWDHDILPTLKQYISIPNKSALFDKDWKKNGYMDKAMTLIADWCRAHPAKDMSLDILCDEGRSPLLLIDIPGQIDDTVLLYGHMDKQPEMRGWDDNKGPWTPVTEAGKLYGRGGADDGYAIFSAMTAITTLQKEAVPHARCLILIEASEESGSIDLEHYITQLKTQIGTPSLIVCLDSGAGNYDQLWSTTSLRGVVGGHLSIQVLKQGLHSGLSSGVVPSVFLILQTLLNRIQDPKTGTLLMNALHVDIPKERIEQAKLTAQTLKHELLEAYCFAEHTQAVHDDIATLLLNRTWCPSLSIVGIDGIPSVENAGNVTLPSLTLKLSLRIPPTLDPETAQHALKEALEHAPPFNADIHYIPEEGAAGWNAPNLEPWLREANDQASHTFFNKHAAYFGEGGSIPFMGMLGEQFPKAQFLITGVLGPQSNAHGPNEFLHIDYVKRLTGCIASVLSAHAKRL